MVSYRVGGREYPLKTVPRCHVCMSPHRFEIEEQIVAGRTYRKIHEAIADLDENAPSIRNITDHYNNGHMPLEMSSTRQIVEARARAVGKRVEEGTEDLADGISLLQVVVQKTFEAIAAGKIEPGVRDGLRATKLLGDLGEYDGAGVDQQAFMEAFMVYHETAEDIMSPEDFHRFGELLESNPVLKALAARYDGQDVVEGEWTEEQEPVELPPADSSEDA